MFADRVVVNTSALIVLFNSNQEDLLPRLFSEIIVPEAVFEEVTTSKNDRAAESVSQATWLKTRKANAIAVA